MTILIKWNMEALNLSSMRDKMGRVFSIVLRGLRDIIAKAPEELSTNQIILRDAACLKRLAQQRISILAVMFKAQNPGDMINPCAQIGDLSIGHTCIVCNLFGRILDAMAEP